MILILDLIAFALSAFALILAVVVNRRLVKQNKELKEKIDISRRIIAQLQATSSIKRQTDV